MPDSRRLNLEVSPEEAEFLKVTRTFGVPLRRHSANFLTFLARLRFGRVVVEVKDGLPYRGEQAIASVMFERESGVVASICPQDENGGNGTNAGGVLPV
jgi:hypothetical protein